MEKSKGVLAAETVFKEPTRLKFKERGIFFPKTNETITAAKALEMVSYYQGKASWHSEELQRNLGQAKHYQEILELIAKED